MSVSLSTSEDQVRKARGTKADKHTSVSLQARGSAVKISCLKRKGGFQYVSRRDRHLLPASRPQSFSFSQSSHPHQVTHRGPLWSHCPTATGASHNNASAMSFDRLSSLESQPTTTRRQDDPVYRDDPEFQRFTESLSTKLFELTSNISRLSNQISLLGTKRDTERVRERVHDMLQETRDGFKEVGEGIKRAQSWDDLNVSRTEVLSLIQEC